MNRLRAARLALAALVVVLLVPFVARSRKTAAPTAEVAHETLVIITANNESIRYEFGARVPRAHGAAGPQRRRRLALAGRRRRDRPHPRLRVRRLVRAPLARRSAPALDRRDRGGLLAARSPTAPAPATVAEARRAFLASDVGAGVDIVFGGGSPEFVKYAAAGRIVDAGHRPAPPRAVRTGRHPGRARRRDLLGSRRALGRRVPVQLRHLLQPRRARPAGHRRAAHLLERRRARRSSAARSRSPIRRRARRAARRSR